MPYEAPVPTTDPAQVVAPQGATIGASAGGPIAGVTEAMFTALTSEPSTGVGVIAVTGKILYLNDQAARIFHGPAATAKQYVGRSWSDHMPAEWVDERLKLFRSILIHDKPVLVRAIWRGFQHFTWITRIDRDVDTAADTPELFLTITRRAGSDEEAELLRTGKDYEEVESGVMRLGRLDVLSARELEVLALLGQGLSVREVAEILHRSEKTIDNHRTNIHGKLNVGDRVHLAEIARRAGLTLADSARERV